MSFKLRFKPKLCLEPNLICQNKVMLSTTLVATSV